ncbi:hypothetical protein B0H10DRAFT_1955941 [Mycena sp. CBHHK59/15]|nr:hypothetical protein B0H10DRAFT_1955941 [Mycena sp. CBHHK59/15]
MSLPFLRSNYLTRFTSGRTCAMGLTNPPLAPAVDRPLLPYAAHCQERDTPQLDMMWWDPLPADFAVGSAVTRGLGCLKHTRLSKFLPPINQLVDRCKVLRLTSPSLVIPLLGEIIQHLIMWIEQLQTLPTTFTKMVFVVTSLQRSFLELDALYNYMTMYKLTMSNYLAPPVKTALAQCVSTFTMVAMVAQQLWAAGVPFWFLQPVEVFDTENILSVVPLQEPSFGLPDNDTHIQGTPPVPYSGNSTLEKIAVIRCTAVQTPWYCDPFETIDTRARSPSPGPVASALVQSCSRVHRFPSSRVQLPTAVAFETVYVITDSAKTPATKGPAKTEWDKFSLLALEEMLPSIVSMANALAQVDRSAPQLFHPQEWRDVLEGLMTQRSAPGSKIIHPVLEVSNVSSIEGYPMPIESLPQFSLAQIREIVWQVAETSFRFEFCSLDKQTSKKDRLNEVKACFVGHMLVGVPLEMSQHGWAATMLEEHHRYVGWTAALMLDWTTKSNHPTSLTALETTVCHYYTQVFWEYFGLTAVVPLHLDRDVEKEVVYTFLVGHYRSFLAAKLLLRYLLVATQICVPKRRVSSENLSIAASNGNQIGARATAESPAGFGYEGVG